MRMTYILLGVAGLIFHLAGSHALGNFSFLIIVLNLLNHFYFQKWISSFQNNAWPRFKEWYGRKLTWALNHIKTTMVASLALFIISFVAFNIRSPKMEFFPSADPNFIYTYIKLPVGTDQAYTDSITKIVEGRINKAIGKDNKIVTSVIANVAVGTNDLVNLTLQFKQINQRLRLHLKRFRKETVSRRRYTLIKSVMQ